jgi:tetratricopeptide (TPR) repeat protein
MKKSSKISVKIYFYILIFFLTVPSIISSQSLPGAQVLNGLNEAYNFDWQNAKKIFTNLIEKYPDDPRGYHYLARVYSWFYLSGKNKTDYRKFVDYSDTTIDKINDQLKDKPENPNLLYLLGSAYTYRAIVFAKAGNYLDAIWATKKSASYLSEALKYDSTKYDAYLGLGLYNFAIGQVPGAFRWALSLAGVEGNITDGLKYLRIASKKGIYSKVEAQYYLSQILSEVLFDYNEASKYLRNLTSRYPNNLLFNYSYAVLQMKEKDLNDAQIILRKIIRRKDTSFVKIISFSNFLVGDIFYRKNNFDSAEVYYLNFLSTAPDNDYTGIAAYRLAVCYEITGDREDAITFFTKSDEGNMDLEDDIYAKRKGEIYSYRPMTKTEISLVRFSNMIEAGKCEAAYDSLNALSDSTQSIEVKSEINYYLTQASYEDGNYKDAMNYASVTLEYDSTPEKWILPFASYFGAKASEKLGDTSAVKYYVDKAEDYNDYDYQEKLKNLLDTIKMTK